MNELPKLKMLPEKKVQFTGMYGNQLEGRKEIIRLRSHGR